MITFLLGGLVTFTLVTAVEGYVLLGVVQRLRTTFEQLLAAAQQLLADVPGKSAERTDGEDVPPRRFFQTLRRLALVVDDVELARWEDDGGAGDDDTEELPVVQPATEPMQRVDIAAGLRVPATPAAPDLLEEEPWRARFTFNDGGRRATALPPTGTGGHT